MKPVNPVTSPSPHIRPTVAPASPVGHAGAMNRKHIPGSGGARWILGSCLAAIVLMVGCSDEDLKGAGEPTESVDVVTVVDPQVGDAAIGPAADAETPPVEEVIENGAPVVDGLEITPTATLLVEVDQGVETPLGLGAQLVYTDGSTTPVTEDLLWTFSDTTVVTTNDDNVPVATGLGSGQVLAVALHQGLYAECSVTVKLLLPDPVIMVDMTVEEVATFESMEVGEGDGAVFWQYPFDATVFPRGMYPPLLQWWPGNANFFRVRLVNTQGLTVTFYTKDSQVQPTRELWQVIGQVPNGEIQMHLTGAEYVAPGGVVWEATTRHVISADATLGGSVYYWEATAGDIMRLDSEDYEPVAEPVFSTNSASGECRGCHTLSPDGSKLAYNFNAKAMGDLGMAWAKNPEPEIMGLGSGVPSNTMAFGPAGNLLVVADDFKMWLGDVSPGTPGGIEELFTIEDTADSGGMYMADAPSWSRDGSALVYGRRDVGFNVLGSSLQRRYWDAETQTFGEAVELLSPEDVPTGNLLMYPSWSPDSKWVVARVSDQIMGKGDGNTSSLILVDGVSGDWVSLDTAGPQDFAHGRPSFSPFMEGGYYWLVFYSTQPYGEESDGFQKQLWVMAIDQDATTGSDPSHPPFWLPGQDLEASNISAFWSKPVCTYEGELCLTDQDCCVGLECALDADLGVGFCESVGCTIPGEYCDFKSENCCVGYSCQQNLAGAFSCQPD